MLRSLQHAALVVPDIEAGLNFYRRMGLEEHSLGNDAMLRCPGREQDQVRLIEGGRKQLYYVSFGTTAPELPGLQHRIELTGQRLAEPPVKLGGDGIWFHDPDGDLVNVRVGKDAPQTRPAVAINNPGEFRRLGKRGAPDRNIEATPRRLGHVLKFTRDLQRAIEFYTGVLGMKLSDRIGEMAAFLRFAGDSDHHTLAFAQSEATGLHHMSFEMGNIDQIQFCAQRMIDGGYRDAWGLGRHIYGSNYFHYLRDPWNSLVEFFWDIDFIPGTSHWEVEDAAAGPDSLYQWATMPPPADFLVNYERH